MRLGEYRDALLILRDHKILGVGPGNWKILYQPIATNVAEAYPQTLRASGRLEVRPVWFVPNRLNNDWIGFAVERGLPAVIALIAALAIVAVRSVRSFLRPEHVETRVDRGPELIALITMLAALALVGSFDAVLQLPAPTYLVFLTLGAVAPAHEPLWSVLPSTLRRAAAAMTGLLMAVIAAFTLNQIYVSYLIARTDPDSVVEGYRLALDKRWFFNEVTWTQSALWKGGRYPACD